MTIAKEFIQFLEERGMHEAFMESFDPAFPWIKNKRLTIGAYLGYVEPQDYVVSFCEWANSFIGSADLSQLHEQWLKYLEMRELITGETIDDVSTLNRKLPWNDM